MTATSTRKAPSRSVRIPWFIHPWTLIAANVVCLAINVWASNVEAHRRDQFANTCGKVIGMTGPVAVAVIVIFAVTALSLLLMIAWCVRKRASGGGWGTVIGVALILVVLVALNMLLAGGDLSYNSFSFDCTGP